MLTQAEGKENVFDENGQTVEEVEAASADAGAEEDSGEAEAATEVPASGKYRIGDKTFATQDEALAYAQSQVSALETEQQIADAYRQGMREALQTAPSAGESVTSNVVPKNDLDSEELYTNPQAFLDKFATKIKSETKAEIDQRESLKAQSDQIWREFTERHPGLADFRSEVEQFVQGQVTEVRAIISTKGKPASYDWIATKLKSRFEAYANAVKPKRELPNTGSGASPSSKSGSVTQKEASKKPLSFADEIRNMRKKR